MLKLNKICTWEEIVLAYPDLYAIVTDIKEKDGEINTCKLLAISNKENKHNYVKKYLDKGIEFDCIRTTDSMPSIGVI